MYFIQDGDRADTLAHQIYGDSTLHWIIMYANYMTNPYYDWPLAYYDLRKFGVGKNKQLDDTNYGGGPGMILKPEPIFKGVEYIKDKHKIMSCPVVLMSPQGKLLKQNIIAVLTACKKLFGARRTSKMKKTIFFLTKKKWFLACEVRSSFKDNMGKDISFY